MTFSYQKEDDFEAVSKSAKIGQAVHDILSKEQKDVEVGEIIEEYGETYTEQVREAIARGSAKYQSPFYVVVLHKKEMWALNVMRNWFVARQSKPTKLSMWGMFPNFMHTVYEVDAGSGSLNLLWTLPSPQEADVIIKNWDLYDPNLVKWCQEAFAELKAS